MASNITLSVEVIKLDFRPSELYFLTVFSVLQCFTGSLANGITLNIMVFKGRLQHSPSHLLISNLAKEDFMSCAVFLPLHIYALQQDTLSIFLRSIYHIMCLFHVFSNGNAILLITLDRFIAVTYPLRYKSIVTHWRISIIIILSWLMPIISAAAFHTSVQHGSPEYSEYALRIYMMLSLIIVLGLYFLVYKAARHQRLRIKSETPSSSGTCSTTLLHRYPTWKSIVNTLFIVGLYFLTYVPIMAYDLRFSLDSRVRYTSLSERFYAWVLSFTFINSCVDPFFYALRNRQFRKDLFQIFAASRAC